jgi:type IV secretory pathway VirB10-like protein
MCIRDSYEPVASNRERGIYRTGTDIDPKYQKEDYEADKQSFFAFSRSYRGATYYVGQASQDQKSTRVENAEPEIREGASEFEGKSEAEIVASLTEKYKKKALTLAGDLGASGGRPQRANKQEAAPPVAIIYNKLTPVKCYQGQNLDCVLLHKLVADTEESPVIAAVSKDFFDASGKYVAIPSGTRVIGRSQVVNYNGASRLYVWFDRIILPNGISVALPQSGSAMDVQGSLGIVSNIDRHFWQKYGSAIFVGLLDGLGGLAQANTSDTQMRYMFGRSSENFGEINKLSLIHISEPTRPY